MKKMIVVVAALLLASSAVLLSLAPDTLSMMVLLVMCFFVGLGFFLGLMPALLFGSGFQTARWNLQRATDVQSTESWIAVFKFDQFFGQKALDALFRDYKQKALRQREEGEIVSDIEEYINEDALALRTWQAVVAQIPGTLTGLGLLGTFIGLIAGISSIGFSSVEAALESVSTLLQGIETAFYTSISGVILSILFNISNRMVWNTLLREHGLFLEVFHKLAIPTAEEQSRKRQNRDMQTVLARLERLPRMTAYSMLGDGDAMTANEQLLMPRIVEGLKNGEFTFYLEPRMDFISRKPAAAEAVVRWENETLGPQSPDSFLPILEKNGFVTRLDMYIWEEVCKTIRRWIDSGIRPVPVSVNLSRTDILAADVVGFFSGMLEKYRIPPRALELEISQNAFLQSAGTANEMAGQLRRMGFKVIMDDFNGDYIAVNMLEDMEVDALKLNLDSLETWEINDLYAIFDHARKLNVEIMAQFVENAEQLSDLKRAGCQKGQGRYFGKTMTVGEFEALSGQE